LEVPNGFTQRRRDAENESLFQDLLVIPNSQSPIPNSPLTNMSISEFQQFFDNCVGNWTTERTYHYLTQQEVERSHTEFNVEPITDELKLKVIQDNDFEIPADLSILPGYHKTSRYAGNERVFRPEREATRSLLLEECGFNHRGH
jgi:CpeS-like protein